MNLKSVAERRVLVERQFKQADPALEQRDPASHQATVATLTALATSSPFRDLVSLDARRAALKRDEAWES